MRNVDSYVAEITDLFSSNANPLNVLPMKKYMKDLFDFYGIKTPERRELTKIYLEKSNLPPKKQLPRIVKKFWNLPQRENQYFALELTERYVKQLDDGYIPLFEFMITNNSWWDTVDFIAANLVGSIFKKYPENILPKSGEWLNSNNIWLQRTVLLFQLKYKKSTDTRLLFNAIRKLTASDEFFIRKAIGWALREYSKTDPDAVLKFVDSTELSNLSKREAIRLIK